MATTLHAGVVYRTRRIAVTTDGGEERNLTPSLIHRRRVSFKSSLYENAGDAQVDHTHDEYLTTAEDGRSNAGGAERHAARTAQAAEDGGNTRQS